MTDKVLVDYYNKNSNRYKSMTTCTSVPEILLKIQIYGKQWNQYDWALFLCTLCTDMAYDDNVQSDDKYTELFNDIISTIDDTSDLDFVFTNKKIILTIIDLTKKNTLLYAVVRKKLYFLLAHVLKKFPALWNMSWMYTTYKDQTTKQHHKYHRLQSAVTSKKSTIQCIDFIQQYINS